MGAVTDILDAGLDLFEGAVDTFVAPVVDPVMDVAGDVFEEHGEQILSALLMANLPVPGMGPDGLTFAPTTGGGYGGGFIKTGIEGLDTALNVAKSGYDIYNMLQPSSQTSGPTPQQIPSLAYTQTSSGQNVDPNAFGQGLQYSFMAGLPELNDITKIITKSVSGLGNILLQAFGSSDLAEVIKKYGPAVLSIIGGKLSYDDQKRINDIVMGVYNKYNVGTELKNLQYRTGQGLASLPVLKGGRPLGSQTMAVAPQRTAADVVVRPQAQMGGIMSMNQEEQPIFPRLETLSQNLGQAEQTLGQPNNQYNMSSITTAITGQQPQGFEFGGRAGYGFGGIINSVKKQIKNQRSNIGPRPRPIQPGPAVDPIGPRPGMQQPIPRDYGYGNQLPPGSIGFPRPGMQQPIRNINDMGPINVSPFNSTPVEARGGMRPDMQIYGGRVGYAEGGSTDDEMEIKKEFYYNRKRDEMEDLLDEYQRFKMKKDYQRRYPRNEARFGGRMGYAIGSTQQPMQMQSGIRQIMQTPEISLPPAAATKPVVQRIMNNPEAVKALMKDPRFINILQKVKASKMQGRPGYRFGSLPMRTNQAGITELDYRQKGGFVPPIGIKEKADDIPAMLSNNEFVFTADAVRGAGGGSVNKGAKKMYGLMKQLEGRS